MNRARKMPSALLPVDVARPLRASNRDRAREFAIFAHNGRHREDLKNPCCEPRCEIARFDAPPPLPPCLARSYPAWRYGMSSDGPAVVFEL